MTTNKKLTRKELMDAASDLNKTLRLFPPIGFPKTETLMDINTAMAKEEVAEIVDAALQKADPQKMTASQLEAKILEEMSLPDSLTDEDPVSPDTRRVVAIVLENANPPRIPDAPKKKGAKNPPQANKKGANEGVKPKSGGKDGKASKVARKPGSGGEKKVGVIASIEEILRTEGPVTKEQILAGLMKRFPQREEKSMMGTVNAQIPKRMARERGFEIVKTKEGAFKIVKGDGKKEGVAVPAPAKAAAKKGKGKK